MKHIALTLLPTLALAILPGCKLLNPTRGVKIVASSKDGGGATEDESSSDESEESSDESADESESTDAGSESAEESEDSSAADSTASASSSSSSSSLTDPKTFFSALDNARLDFPCSAAPTSKKDCTIAGTVGQTLKITGDSNTLYTVELRVRGVVEPMIYTGGAAEGDSFYISGRPNNTLYSIMRMSTSSPKLDYFMNAAKAVSTTVYAIDYTTKISIFGGSTVTLFGDGQNGSIIANVAAITVTGLTTPSSLTTGQFIQLNVISVTSKTSALK